MSRRFFKSPAHHAEKTRLWEVINLWHAYKVVFVQGTTVNIFVLLCLFPLWVRVTPAAPRTAPFAGCCYSGQHPRQFPGVPGEAQLPQKETRTVCTVVRNKTPCNFLSLKFAVIRSCSCSWPAGAFWGLVSVVIMNLKWTNPAFKATSKLRV